MYTNRSSQRGQKIMQPRRILNILKPWVYERIDKSMAHCERMLRLDCLLQLYKCMDDDCSFSTSCANKMAAHMRQHPKDRFLQCAYCSDWLHSDAMIGHVDKEHRLSKFQCSHCFFRAFDAYCVVVHQNNYHPNSVDGDILDILTDETETRRMQLRNNVRSRFDTVVKCFECSDCKQKMLTPSAYQAHIEHIGGLMIRCQFCRVSISKENIFSHLLIHDIGLFECIYCKHAVWDSARMALHISNCHSSKPMYYISRLQDRKMADLVKKSNLLKSMAFNVFTKKVLIAQGQEETQETNRSNAFPTEVEIFDTEEDTKEKVDTKSLQPISSDESLKSPSTAPASIKTAVMTAPSHLTKDTKKDPKMPVIVKIQGGVKFSDTGDIIGDSESVTTVPHKHMATTENSIIPVEANQQLSLASIPPKMTREPSSCVKFVKTSLPITPAKVAQGSITKKPKLLVSHSSNEASTTKQIPTIKRATEIKVEKRIANISETDCVPSQRFKVVNVKLPKDNIDSIKAKPCEQIEPALEKRERKRGAETCTIPYLPGGTDCPKTDVPPKKACGEVRYLLHDCNHLIKKFRLALESMLSKTEIDGTLGLKDGCRCYCCILCYHCTYDLSGLGEHFQLQHRIHDATITLVHADRDNLQSDIVLMLPTVMTFEMKVAKMEELIRTELHDVQQRSQEEEDRLIDKSGQQKAKVGLSQALVDNDTAKVKCYPSARKKLKVLSEICSVSRDELAKKHPDYQSHIRTMAVNHNSQFVCPYCAKGLNCAESVENVFSHLNSHQVFLFDTIETLVAQRSALRNSTKSESDEMRATQFGDPWCLVCFLCCYSNNELIKMTQHVVSDHHFESKVNYCVVPPKVKKLRKRILLVYPINLCGSMKLARICELVSFNQCNANNALVNTTTVSPGSESRSRPITNELERTIPANVVDKADCGQLYKCGFCHDHTPKSRLQLLMHLDTKCMFKGIDYRCGHCDVMLDCRVAKSNDFNADIIFEHLYYHGENLYRCSVCDMIHYKRMIIKKHLLREHHQHDGVVVVRESSVWWDCSLCDLRTRYRQTIMEHMMTKHNLPGERYMCGHCQHSDYSTEYFKDHMAISHPEVAGGKLQIIEMYTSVAVEKEVANTSGTTETSVVTASNEVGTEQSLMEPIEVSSIPTGSTKSFSEPSQKDLPLRMSPVKSTTPTESLETIEQECAVSSPVLNTTYSAVVQQSVSAASTNESKDQSPSNLLKEAPSTQESSSLTTVDNSKSRESNVVQDTEIPLLVGKDDIGILKSILPIGTPLTKTKFGVRLRLESPTMESNSGQSKPAAEKLVNDVTLNDINTEQMMEQLQRTDIAMVVEIASEKSPTPKATSRRSTRVAMQKDATQQWSNSTVFACYFCKHQFDSFDSLKSHMCAKHAEQELLNYVAATEKNLQCVFQLLPLLRCFYCMGTTVGTYDQLLAHCKADHTGKTFACVDFWNVFKCGFCSYLNGSGIQKEIQDHFMAIHGSEATTSNSCDYVDNDFLAWALTFGETQVSDDLVRKAELVRYICHRCGAHADSEELLGEHMAYHLFHFACQYCPSTFKELKVLYEHATTMHAQTGINVPRTFNIAPHHEQLFNTLAMFSNGLIMSKRELLTTTFLSYMQNLNKGIQTSYRRQLADLARYKSDLLLPLETSSGDESEGETCASFIKKQFFYPALILSQVGTTDAEYGNEPHVQVKSEEANIPEGTERGDTIQMRRTSRI